MLLFMEKKKINNMKTILLVATLTLFLGCTTNSNIKQDDNSFGRIKILESRTIEGTIYHIIEVDGTQYLSHYKGGIVKLEKPTQ